MEWVLRRDRAMAALALLAATVLAWVSLFGMHSGMGPVDAGGMAMPGMQMATGGPAMETRPPRPSLPAMTAVSFLVLAAGTLIAYLFGDFTPAHYHPAATGHTTP